MLTPWYKVLGLGEPYPTDILRSKISVLWLDKIGPKTLRGGSIGKIKKTLCETMLAKCSTYYINVHPNQKYIGWIEKLLNQIWIPWDRV